MARGKNAEEEYQMTRPHWLGSLVYVGLGLLLPSCDALFQTNPNNCMLTPNVCSSDEYCDPVSESCQTLDCTINTTLCSSSEYCDPASKRCQMLNCVVAPTLCTATQFCNMTTAQCQTITFVLGQPDEMSNLNTAYGMSGPESALLVPDPVNVGNTLLIVGDTGNQRVLIWNNLPTQNRPADAVLGMPDLNTVNASGPYGGVTERSLSTPWSVASDGTQLVVADQVLNRLLIWSQTPRQLSGGAPIPANRFWGQTGFSSSLPNAGQTTVNSLGTVQPRIFLDTASAGFYLADSANNRVLAFAGVPNTFAAAPSRVIGQPDFVSNGMSSAVTGLTAPRSVGGDGSSLFVTDTGNNRVVSYTLPISANGPSASPTLLFGQSGFGLGLANRGGAVANNTLSSPSSACLVTGPPELLFVSDQNNNRVLRFTLPSTTADLVLGQADFVSNQGNRGTGITSATLFGPSEVSSDGVHLAVADTTNHRVLIWQNLPTQLGQAADVVLGQPSATARQINNPPAAGPLQFRAPGAVYSDGTRLLVADNANNRVLLWNQIPEAGSTAPDVVLGQTDFMTGTAGGFTASTFHNPGGMSIENGVLAIADSGGDRILIWNQIPTQNDAPADLAVGQPNLTTGGPQPTTTGMSQPTDVRLYQGTMVVADQNFNRVLIYNTPFTPSATASIVLGQPTLTTGAPNQGGQSASSLYSPWALAIDSGKLFVADRNNDRVLIWNTLPTTNFQPADVVVGQTDFLNSYTDIDNIHLNSPDGVLVLNGRLYVSASAQNRILYWNQVPTQNGQPADGVLGQDEFLSFVPNNPNLLPIEKLSAPAILSAAADQLFIADTQNNRVVVRNLP
jgi:hypothetical protein